MEENKSKKVLLAFPTSDAKDYCLKEFCEQLVNITYHCDILVIDNSEDNNHIHKIMNELSNCKKQIFYTHIHENIPIKDLICKCHNEIRSTVLGDGYDFLFSLESDIFINPNIIEHLLSLNYRVVGVPYFLGLHFRSNYICFESEVFGKIKGSSPMLPNRAFMNFHDGTIKKCNQLGLGCILIHRSVLEKITFRVEEGCSWDSFDDTFFHKDLQKLGIAVYCDTSLMATHMNRKWVKR